MTGRLRQSATLLGFALIILFFAIRLPETFLTARNLLNISQQLSMLMVVAATMTIVMVMNDFDLSVGSMASLSGIVAAVLFVAGGPIWAALAVALLVGLLGGLFNGVLVAVIGILPFVATLGTLTVFSGLALYVSDGTTIFGRDIPAEFSGFARSGVSLDAMGLPGLKLPALSLVAFAVIIVTWVLLEHTSYGRKLYAVGGNIEAAHLAGIRVVRVRLIAFGLTGLGAATAGLMFASRVASANPTQGAGLMLDAIAAVFLGMTMTRRGEPRVLYTMVGVLMLGIIDNGLTQLRVDSFIREILVGCIVIAAVAVAQISKRRGT